MGIGKQLFAFLVAVLLAGMTVAAVSTWRPDSLKSDVGLGSASNEKIWDGLRCRAGLFLRKALGDVPEFSWSDLWWLVQPGRGFYCNEGSSLAASLTFSGIATGGDREAGAQIFRQRCARCHGSNASGGPVGPALTRSEYDHGDSDLAIYEVLRNGIAGTAMPKAGLPIHQALQVIAYLRVLQTHTSEAQKSQPSRLAVQVSDAQLRAAGTNADEWLTYSGSYNGWRHTSLAQITPANVAQLHIRWIKQFDIAEPDIEATPLAIDGVIYMVADAGHVLALDEKTGDVIWQYKRPIPSGLPLEYGLVNRGLAAYGSTLFFGSLDGHLVAIDANSGKVLWQTLVASPAEGYSMTGAPLVADRSVVAGVSGGEFGIRGFLAAYDVSTGKRLWKFNTIPGPGEFGHETWRNDAWRKGGGATWVTGSYDPSADLLYWGVGNPSPAFAGDVRPGDNLFTASVIALHAKTGQLAWYFQFTPHDEHDRDAAQTPVLADLPIKGAVRKVICWPNRNGFYYVLDRVTGQFLAGVPFVEVNWATGLTAAGRPILANIVQISTAGRATRPGIGGGTNWQNPAFDPKRDLIFVPATEGSSVFTKAPPGEVAASSTGMYTGSGWAQTAAAANEVVALDAATGRRRWKHDGPAGDHSGLFSTAGGLVFGASGGTLFALDADTGRELWRVALGGKTKAAPISIAIDGRQVIVVSAGRGLFMFGL
jgi:alcohol dehydrogenase (cytochrome c)